MTNYKLNAYIKLDERYLTPEERNDLEEFIENNSRSICLIRGNSSAELSYVLIYKSINIPEEKIIIRFMNKFISDLQVAKKIIEEKDLVEANNIKHLLALASMTEEDEWIVGEYLAYKDPFFEDEVGIFRINELEGTNLTAGKARNDSKSREIYRKATFSEINKALGKLDTFKTIYKLINTLKNVQLECPKQ